MIHLLRSRPAARPVDASQISTAYEALRLRALFGVFIGYAGYYFVRSNFTLSTPYLMKALSLTKTDIGILSSCLLITYGISKGVMSSLADKCNPKRYMAAGILLSCLVNVLMGFGTEFWMFVALVILNGLFQGMGAGPAFITIASWFPRAQRGRTTALWSISHNVGAGLVPPIALGAIAVFGASHWQMAIYWAPSAAAALVALVVMGVGVGTTRDAGMPSLKEMFPHEAKNALVRGNPDNAPEDLTSFGIFRGYVLTNKHVWYVSFVDAFVYLVRFGVITWLPIYLLQVKGFTRDQMGMAFTVFESAAIPSTLFAGVLTDKLFRGRRMPLAMAAMAAILAALFFYWHGHSLLEVTVACGLIGCLIYVPQFLASVQTMEVVPSFAVGSATGLRGFMSYVVGSTLGTALIGKLVDLYGWSAGFYTLVTGALLCILFCHLSHRGTLELEAARAKADERPAVTPVSGLAV